MAKPQPGYSGTPIAKKLGIKEGHLLWLVDAPEGFVDYLELDPSVMVVQGTPEERTCAVIVVFRTTEESMEGTHATLEPYLKWNGGLWISWPKQSSSMATSLKEGHVRQAGLASGLVDNKVCAVDMDWSGLRFVYRKEDRPKGF